MDSIVVAATLSVLNVILLAALLFVYVKNYKQIKSKFCIGLIFFALLLVVQNASGFYFHTNIFGYCAHQIAEFAIILNILEAIAIGVLLYVTVKPCM